MILLDNFWGSVSLITACSDTAISAANLLSVAAFSAAVGCGSIWSTILNILPLVWAKTG